MLNNDCSALGVLSAGGHLARSNRDSLKGGGNGVGNGGGNGVAAGHSDGGTGIAVGNGRGTAINAPGSQHRSGTATGRLSAPTPGRANPPSGVTPGFGRVGTVPTTPGHSSP